MNDELILACKACRKTFRIDVRDFEESDEHCPHCDAKWYTVAVTPEMKTSHDRRGKGIMMDLDDMVDERDHTRTKKQMTNYRERMIEKMKQQDIEDMEDLEDEESDPEYDFYG